MIEFPEAVAITEQLNENMAGKKIMNVIAAQTPHKFAWYYGDPQSYHELLHDKVVENTACHGGMIEIKAGDACVLLGEGINLRYYHGGEEIPARHQLQLEFEDNSSLIGSVQMYGGLWAYPEGQNTNPYYLVAKEKPSPLSTNFDEAYFDKLINEGARGLSLKALLATEQRIPGLGNGVLQDILFNAGLHPKKKLNTLTDSDKCSLFQSIKNTLAEMAVKGGRDTERDLFGCFGGYRTILSKNTAGKACSVCGNVIKKESYMGGSIYYCPGCQKL